jgi:hypothetical protein
MWHQFMANRNGKMNRCVANGRGMQGQNRQQVAGVVRLYSVPGHHFLPLVSLPRFQHLSKKHELAQMICIVIRDQ